VRIHNSVGQRSVQISQHSCAKGLQTRPWANMSCEQGQGGTQRGGEPQRLRKRAYRRLIRSARGGAVLNGPEALAERKAGGQELTV
jgi:hypothetical protein